VHCARRSRGKLDGRFNCAAVSELPRASKQGSQIALTGGQIQQEVQPMSLSHDAQRIDFRTYRPKHFLWSLSGKVATISLNRPERKNPLTFESYAELRDTFRELLHAAEVKTVVITGAGGNFCSGGDVHEIIGPLVRMQEAGDVSGLLDFTRMTGDLVKAMRACPQIVISAIDGICAGAGAILAMASDLRLGTSGSKVAFLFVRVGLCGADMGACSILPRIVGAGRAADLLYTGRAMDGIEAERWGFYNRLVGAEKLLAEAQTLAATLASGPTFAHAMTKRCLHQEWDMPVDEAIEGEAQAQAICMQTKDFGRAYHAFVAKERPVFEGD
jgi:enoyl-CoA hydratase/carnithine racemase